MLFASYFARGTQTENDPDNELSSACRLTQFPYFGQTRGAAEREAGVGITVQTYLNVQRLTPQLELVSRVYGKKTLTVRWSQWEAQVLGGKMLPDSETVEIFVIPKDSGTCREAVPNRRE